MPHRRANPLGNTRPEDKDRCHRTCEGLEEIPEEEVSNDVSNSAIAAEVQNGPDDVVHVGLDGRLEPQGNWSRQVASDPRADLEDDASMLEKENFELREQNDVLQVKYGALREQLLQMNEAFQIQ